MTLTKLSPRKIDWIHFLDTFKQIFSPEHLNENAVQHGFKTKNRKINLEDFVALHALYNEETGVKSLSQLCANLYDFKNVNVTEKALNQHVNQRAVDF
ncbi:hypothetical protein QUF99_18790 [Bacillus sp. DX4.1]|uniref:hypothetical protein n=1 Tax=Bacillus sp. DX4.1 TaxID=3055867 RepID=UPI0025A0045C|nr:hypothetical protein [Bacillus sp. DX4.1]MDM5189273.1 hypothetical protein [Bacillus sp. DX4.1]